LTGKTDGCLIEKGKAQRTTSHAGENMVLREGSKNYGGQWYRDIPEEKKQFASATFPRLGWTQRGGEKAKHLRCGTYLFSERDAEEANFQGHLFRHGGVKL